MHLRSRPETSRAGSRRGAEAGPDPTVRFLRLRVGLRPADRGTVRPYGDVPGYRLGGSRPPRWLGGRLRPRGSWEAFADFVKQVPGANLESARGDGEEGIIGPAETLKEILRSAVLGDLVHNLSQNSILYRARVHPPGGSYSTAEELGSAPLNKTRPNRMSPPASRCSTAPPTPTRLWPKSDPRGRRRDRRDVAEP